MRHGRPGPAGRPCRRSTFRLVRGFLHAATARAARSIPVVRAIAPRSVSRSPRPGPRTRSRVGSRMSEASPARAGKAQSAPPCRRPARRSSCSAPSGAHARCRAHARPTACGKAAPHEDAPMPRRLARKCHRGHSGGQLVVSAARTPSSRGRRHGSQWRAWQTQERGWRELLLGVRAG